MRKSGDLLIAFNKTIQKIQESSVVFTLRQGFTTDLHTSDKSVVAIF